MKEVHKASKRAKTFETQKVVKKLKDSGYELELQLTCLFKTFLTGKKAIIPKLSRNTKRN